MSGDSRLLRLVIPATADSLLAFWIPDTMKNMVAGASYFSIVRE